MVRKLKYHEQKLLKKVDFITWKSDKNHREISVMRRYHIQKTEDYAKYNKMCDLIKSVASKIKQLDQNDPFRMEATSQLLEKLYGLGVVKNKGNLESAQTVTVSSFCRRRLPVVMVRAKMTEHIKTAVKYVEQGHVRVGPEVITDPAYLLSRNMEDFLTWTDTSKIKKHIMEYNDQRDDFDLM